MASAVPVPSTSSGRTGSVRRRLRTADVLAEIFNDSDSAESADESDSDTIPFDGHDDSQTEASDVAADSDEEVTPGPPAKKRKRQGSVSTAANIHLERCHHSATGSPIHRSVRDESGFVVTVAR